MLRYIFFLHNNRLADHINIMFEERPPWDSEGKYVPNRLKIYYENTEQVKLYAVKPENTLRQILSQKT